MWGLAWLIGLWFIKVRLYSYSLSFLDKGLGLGELR